MAEVASTTPQPSHPHDSDNESDSSNIGPTLPPPTHRQKRPRILEHEAVYLDNLPSQELYERSLMHRDVVNFVGVSRSDFLVTTSVDGHVKFWKKGETGIEFVKHFRAHLGAIIATSVSADGALLATASVDKAVKIFDIVNFDMINILKLEYQVYDLCWIYNKGQADFLLACSDKDSSEIKLFNGKGSSDPYSTITKLHSKPVHIMRYNSDAQVVVSVDEGGMVEYWEPSDQCAGYVVPSSRKIEWKYKSETDLYEFKKSKTIPTSLDFSPDFTKFVTFGFSDRIVRIFNFSSAKLIRKFDESLSVITEMQQAGTSSTSLDPMEFGRRIAVEREIEKGPEEGVTTTTTATTLFSQYTTSNAIFDETSNFVIYPTLLGIKMVNIHTNKVVRMIGKSENQRYMNLALYQGAPKKKSLVTLAMAASDNQLYRESERRDPTLVCTAYKQNRFYLFTQRKPDAQNRDIFNERPSREEQAVSLQPPKSLPTLAILHTSLGDIHIKLFPASAPRAVENFILLARSGRYNNTIFHRVIKSFMLQTGDPLGDGTGGESAFGLDFEDEFQGGLKHDRPYTVSMANCGPNTNASQFFITTVVTPWLDNKHTIFGRATGGMDTIQAIERVECDKHDRPKQKIYVVDIEIKSE